MSYYYSYLDYPYYSRYYDWPSWRYSSYSDWPSWRYSSYYDWPSWRYSRYYDYPASWRYDSWRYSSLYDWPSWRYSSAYDWPYYSRYYSRYYDPLPLPTTKTVSYETVRKETTYSPYTGVSTVTTKLWRDLRRFWILMNVQSNWDHFEHHLRMQACANQSKLHIKKWRDPSSQCQQGSFKIYWWTPQNDWYSLLYIQYFCMFIHLSIKI